MLLNIMQELVTKAAVIVLEIYRRALVDVWMLLNVLFGRSYVLDAIELYDEVELGVL